MLRARSFWLNTNSYSDYFCANPDFMAPSVSIIMTVYNRELTIATAIKSVLTQTYGDFELLIFDDGSTDNSLNIAKDSAGGDTRIRVVAATHLGRTPALIAAHSQAQGNYLGWVDSDDALAPTALAETVAVLENHPEFGLVYTDYLVIDRNNYVTGYGQRCRIPYSKERLLIDFMTFHFRLFSREVFSKAGGIDADFIRAPDYDLCLRLSEITQVWHLEKPLYYYRNHTDNISHQHRIEQILWSKEAINRALRRRGLADSYQVEVEIVGRFSLRQLGDRRQETGDKSQEPGDRS